LFASVVERFAQGVRVIERTAPGLVERIEAGDLDGRRTRDIATEALGPILEAGADTLVLACTHYPFVIPLLSELAGPGMRIIDPAPAIARQTGRVLEQVRGDSRAQGAGQVSLITTGDVVSLEQLAPRLMGESAPVSAAEWSGEALVLR
jgi:glutamate racemase